MASDSSDEIIFKDNSLSDGWLATVADILNEGKLSDVTLIIGDRRIPANRMVLAASVPYFRTMFTSEFSESSKNEIILQSIDPGILEKLIDFIYKGRILINCENVEALLAGAVYLQMDKLRDVCAQFLQDRISTDNAFRFRQLAIGCGPEPLQRAVDKYIKRNFTILYLHKDFAELTIEELEHFLKLDALAVEKESTVFEALITWVQKKPIERKEHLFRLLQCVRLPLLDMEYIFERVLGEESIRRCLQCRDFIDEAIFYKTTPSVRNNLTMVQKITSRVLPGTIYAMDARGEADSDCLEKYDPETKQWSMVAPRAKAITGYAVAVIDRQLYAIGGRGDSTYVLDVQLFDSDSETWTTVASLNTARNRPCAAAIDDKVFICGGCNRGSPYALDTVEVYCRVANNCTSTTPMLERRAGGAAVALYGKLYVLGGWNGSDVLDSVEVFDIETRVWSAVKPMLQRRTKFGAAVAKGKIYACGAWGGGTNAPCSVECYDPLEDKWTQLADMNTTGVLVSLVYCNDNLYAIGGYKADTIIALDSVNSVEMYDFEKNTWTMAPGMLGLRGEVHAAVIPHRLSNNNS